jgi:uncharacterized membrane protein YfcA
VSGTVVAGALAGLVAGVLSGLFGVGGGIVLVPFLGLLLGLRQHEAQGVTLGVLLLPLGLPAVLAYQRRFPIRWWLVAALVVGFLAGVGQGALLANHMGDRPLRLLFALFLVAVAVQLWSSASARAEPPARGGPAPPSSWNGLWIGAAGGFLAGLFGIGGGLVMVPLLVWTMRMRQHEAQATSLAVLIPPIGLPGFLVYARAQATLPWALLAGVVAGFAVGALAGAHLAVRTRSATLARAFALFVLCAAAALAWKALRGG